MAISKRSCSKCGTHYTPFYWCGRRKQWRCKMHCPWWRLLTGAGMNRSLAAHFGEYDATK